MIYVYVMCVGLEWPSPRVSLQLSVHVGEKHYEAKIRRFGASHLKEAHVSRC